MTTMSVKMSKIAAATGTATELFEFPCSLAQQRFWVLDQLSPGEPCYNIAVRWRLLGKLNPGLVERAFNQMLRRHEVLRTTFRSADGQPMQVVWPEVFIPVPVADVSHLSESERDKEGERITVEDAKKKFDLAAPPLIRATLLRLKEDEHIVLVVVHHSVADGWSIGIMAKELGEFYQAMATNGTPDLPELPIQYADFSVWQQAWLKSKALEPQLAYWKKKLTGLKPLEVEPDFPRPAIRTSNGTIISTLLPRSLTNALKEFSNRQDVTLYTSALAAFKMLMWHCSGQTDIAVGTQVAGRNQVELENLVGCFINTLLLRTEVTGDMPYTDLLHRVQNTVTGAIAHQEMPFEQLVEMLRPKRDLSRNPLFGINFIYQRAFIKNTDFAGITLIDLPSRSPGAIYDLNFFMVERVEGWRWSCEFNTDLYSPETIRRMLASFQGFLEAIVANPNRRVSEFKLSEPPSDQSSTDRKQAKANIEAELTRIWEELLAVSPISPADDFFELGGHSLLATRLLARIDKTFGKTIALATLFQAPTIRQLTALLLGQDTVGSIPGLVALQAKGSKTPLFCLHGIPSMRNLAEELGPDQPFYSVNLPEEMDLKPPYSVERLAALHIQTIQKVQPEGPYRLIGWCREGLLAYEVAQQLQAKGESIDFVVMFDTWIPEYLSRFSKREARAARKSFEIERLRLHGQKMRQMGVVDAMGYLRETLGQVLNDRIRHTRWRLSYRLDTSTETHITKHRSQDEILLLAVSQYLPKKFDGRVLLFRSDKYRTWRHWDSALGWRYLLPHLQVHEVPGIHDSMLTGPHLPEIARSIAAAVSEAAKLSK